MILPLDNLNPIQQQALSIYPTYQKFFDDYKPKQLLVSFENITTIEESISKPRITIGDLCLIYPDSSGKKNVSVDFIKSWLVYLNSILNINKPLLEIDPIAFMIYTDYKCLYLSDFKIILGRIVKNEYGTFYGSVDAQLIMRAFGQYTKDWKALQRKMRAKSASDDDKPKREKTELDEYLHKVQARITREVDDVMRSQFPHLYGLEALSKRCELVNARLDKELPEARKNFKNTHIDERQTG